MRYGLIAFFCCCVLPASTQRTVAGRVVAEGTGQPIAGISVFINNSVVGTSTASDGSFRLTNVPAGDLIVSGVSFESIVYTVKPGEAPLNLRFELKPKVKELDNITIGGYVTESWEKWGNIFLETFIGRTPMARKCILQNKEAIRFRYYKKEQVLEAVADVPLVIVNPQLDYIIRYDLQDFKISFSTSQSYYSGFALFLERNATSKRGAARNRKKAYYGSAMHFIRALYQNRLAEEDFEVRRMIRVPDIEKERVRKIAAQRALQLAKTGLMEAQSQDSAAYYKQVMGRSDYTNYYAPALLRTDSVLTGTIGGYKMVYWNQFLAVTYLGATEDREYLQYLGAPNRPALHQRSLLQLKGPVGIDQRGNWAPPGDLTSSGYWGWSNSVGNMLPLDYEPLQ
ncbi:carboxypeptidase-like regulatory domain-containing protein [Niabella pedocola]|uniref:Carboxypeptidase-like regulatory domain-containing protein n=1 Tax=Niabella pedocola TaxID=1752077 RepID=A0ABS8PY91_9BACT|nr:carboxypeptidase-like regulatory domain-containing protein [Niabella pedocola]MCD2426042.1 carboxypeptidase-like regulatory domain-containing protein [Niabella pedocola]